MANICGLYSREKPYPFILKDDGTIDFGSVEDDNIAYFATLISRHPQIRVGAIANGRYWKTNIRNKEIRKDELVTITENDDEECTYKITSVAVLGEGPI
jgi:hypothetical protein